MHTLLATHTLLLPIDTSLLCCVLFHVECWVDNDAETSVGYAFFIDVH